MKLENFASINHVLEDLLIFCATEIKLDYRHASFVLILRLVYGKDFGASARQMQTEPSRTCAPE